MKFLEVVDPYYALIKAENKEDAKHKKNAENAMNKVLNESSFVRKCSVEEY
ncbi:hypothetical protein [Psychrobacillus sp. MER TA 171]|uniref:hypothetical protein n=1 Tax=Psychrobacillus sp. MER TA 171 TaxID=2939577 RepID=UPI0020424A24|nr:hypothetical protein [Psychrobacillus sp. MER TA 171]MCM3358096.1 hypothetical protein [Psychrobacillus sp. MER TA 171]